MDAIGNLSSHSGDKKENPEPHSNSADNSHHAVTEGLVKQEPNIVISSYGSIIGTGEMVEGSNATIIVTNGYEQETIKTEGSVDIKTEVIERSGVENFKMEKTVKIETEGIEGYGEGTIKMEDTLYTNIEVTEKGEVGIWKNDFTRQEFNMIPQMYNVDSMKTGMAPKDNCSVANQDTRLDKRSANKQHTCPVCGKSFARNCHLTRHKLLHTGEKPYSCTICGKSFGQKAQLTRHEVLHTGEKPYSCPLCGKSFAIKGDLTQHEVLHTGEKPYTCTVCGKSFAKKSNLTQHNFLHTGEKPYSCTLCGKSFAQKSVLTRHELLHVGNKPY